MNVEILENQGIQIEPRMIQVIVDTMSSFLHSETFLVHHSVPRIWIWSLIQRLRTCSQCFKTFETTIQRMNSCATTTVPSTKN